MLDFLNFKKRRADKFHDRGLALSEEGRDAEAIEMYLKAIALSPNKSSSYYNIGLIYKYQGEWTLSLEYNQKAYDLNPDHEGARWNLAIAATALRKWEIARLAWAQNGIELNGDAGPIDMNFGPTPVRLNPDENGEVVWATRIDPVRARIDNIPFAESGYRYGDIVLHDGAVLGHRFIDERKYGVFNVLELFEASPYKTAVVDVELNNEDDLEKLKSMLSARSHEVEDWTSNTRTLCKQCSEGEPHEQHDHELDSEWQAERRLGLAIRNGEDVSALLADWERQTTGKLLSITIADHA